MEQRFSLVGGRGTLTLREEGPRAVFEAEVPDDGRGLYKAYLTGRGERYLLGTLVPERGKLRLRRTVPVEELRRRDLWPPAGGTAELSFAFQKGAQTPNTAAQSQPPEGWSGEPYPGRLLEDRLLSRAAETLHGALLCHVPGGFRLALPYGEGREFPLALLFCFASLELLEEKFFIIFSFNHRGCPIFPHKT